MGLGLGLGIAAAGAAVQRTRGQVKRLASRVMYLEHGRVLADLPVNVFLAGRCCNSSIRRPIYLSMENLYEIVCVF